MNRVFLALPIAAALMLSLSACSRNEDRTTASNAELPRTAQAPSNSDRPAAGTQMNPDTSAPSIPNNPANTDPKKKDRSPPYGTDDPLRRARGNDRCGLSPEGSDKYGEATKRLAELGLIETPQGRARVGGLGRRPGGSALGGLSGS